MNIKFPDAEAPGNTDGKGGCLDFGNIVGVTVSWIMKIKLTFVTKRKIIFMIFCKVDLSILGKSYISIE